MKNSINNEKESGMKKGNDNLSLRYNSGKPQLSYILDAMPALKNMVAVMEFGTSKYERNNWKKGFTKEALLDSLLRHVDAFYSGEDIDPESGEPHVGSIMCNAMFLAYHFGKDSEYWKLKYGKEKKVKLWFKRTLSYLYSLIFRKVFYPLRKISLSFK